MRPKAAARAEQDALLRAYRALADEHGRQAPAALEIRNRIVKANLGLAFSVWKKGYSRRIDRDDALGIGTQGLITAIERFDCSRGLRFSTYATWWIRHALGRTHQNEATLVRVPVHAQDSKKTGECRSAADAARRMCSLDVQIDPDGAATFGDLTADDGALAAFDELEHEEYQGEVARAVAGLPEPQRALARMLAEGCSLAEVADQLGLSKEGARQLRDQTLGRLRRALAA